MLNMKPSNSSHSQQNKLELVKPTVFKVWRPSPFGRVKESGKYITWAITSDRCIHQIVQNSKRFCQGRIGKSWDTLTAFSREQSFENYLNQLLNEGWQLVPPPKPPKVKLPMFPPLLAKDVKPQGIYEAFTPEGLLSAAEETQEIEVKETPVLQREKVTPVIRHLPKTLEKSIDQLDFLLRDAELKQRIQARKDKRILTRSQARRLRELNRLFEVPKKEEPKPFSTQASKRTPRTFKSKQEMLDYIKGRLEK